MFPQEKSLSIADETVGIPAHGGAYRVHWTREQMYRMYEDGVLDQQKHYELIAGELFQKVSMNAPHASVMSKAFPPIISVVGGKTLKFVVNRPSFWRRTDSRSRIYSCYAVRRKTMKIGSRRRTIVCSWSRFRTPHSASTGGVRARTTPRQVSPNTGL